MLSRMQYRGRTHPNRPSSSSLFKHVATPIGRFDLIANRVSQRHFSHFSGVMGDFSRPSRGS